MKFKVAALTFILLAAPLTPANSIVNGTPAAGSDYVVTMLIGKDRPYSFCTGAYLRPRVVVTAAHCVIKDGGRAPELRFPLDDWYVSQPGIDWSTPEAKSSKVKVLKIWTDPDFFNRWEPDKGLMETQVNDVAFLFLEKELTGPALARAASRDEIESFRLGQGRAFHLGYGCIGGANGQTKNNDGKPYLAEEIYGTSYQPAHIPIRDRILSVKYPNGKSVCPGDSGSPLLMKKGSEVIYVGTIFAGGSWENAAKGIMNPGDASVTVLWPFTKNLDEEWSKFLIEDTKNRELKAKQEAEAAAAAELKAKQEAELKAKQEAEAKAAADAEVLKLQLEEFNEVSAAYKEMMKKILEMKAIFPFTSSLLGMETKMKKLPITLGEDLTTARTNISNVNKWLDANKKVWEKTQKMAITCVKGKLTKKVTAVKPLCPAGYKKK